MRVIVIGCGNSGQFLIGKLCELNHAVVVIDEDSAALAAAEATHDILTIEGSGSSPTVLERAEIGNADLVVAVTNRDEINMLACAYAHASGVPHKVARVSDLEYSKDSCKLDLSKLGVDLALSHKQECAREIFNIIHLPGALEVVELFEGRLVVMGLKVSTMSPLLQAPLKDLKDAELLQRVRIMALGRGEDECSIPRGDTQFMIGDDFYAVVPSELAHDFLDWVCPDHPRFEKIVIGGGGDLGLSLARMLEKLSVPIVLLEQDEDRADLCSAELAKTRVMREDLMQHKAMKAAGVLENTAYVAVTGNDENNIISCLLAQRQGASFTIGKVSKPSYVPVINSLSLLDRVVSPHVALTSGVLHFVRGHYVRQATLLHKVPGELQEIMLQEKTRWAGKAIHELPVPKGAIIVAIRRGDEMHSAVGDFVLQPGDGITLFALPHATGKAASIFRK